MLLIRSTTENNKRPLTLHRAVIRQINISLCRVSLETIEFRRIRNSETVFLEQFPVWIAGNKNRKKSFLCL